MNAIRREVLWKIVTVAVCLLTVLTIGSSLINCSRRTRFSCSDGTCISKAKECNGKRDCAGGEDELECDGREICRPRDQNMADLNEYSCVRLCSENTRCSRQKRKICLCDDECGISCVRLRKQCTEDPPQVEHSLRSYVNRHLSNRRVIIMRKSYFFGDVAYYRCKRGLTLRGPLPRCQANGRWSNEIPQCVDTRCSGDPPSVLHSTGGHVTRRVRGRQSIIRQPPYNTGDIFNYVCESGRVLEGHLPTCNNGNWSQELPKCIDYNQCGQSGQTRNENAALAKISRVVGGEDAMEDTWPWFALITKKSSTPETSLERDNLKGGGSIINKHWILTAAHVLHRLNLSNYVVFVGLSERPSKKEFVKSSVKMYSIAEYVEHPDYDVATSYDSDIALIKLGLKLGQSMQHRNADDDAGLTFGLSIRAICLPGCTTYRSESNQNHLRCPWSGNALPGAADAPIIIGFGHTDAALHGTVNEQNFHPPKKLQQATVRIKEQSWCGQQLEQARNETTYSKRRLHLTENMICCKSDRQNGRDACLGDSGGPLMKEMIDGETGTSYWVQIGIISFGIGCASEYPGYYTKVERYTSWIQNAISDSRSDAEATVGICTRNISLVEEGRRCRKPCETRRDCLASNKRCYCDGACGMTCLNRMSECLPPDPPVNGNVTWNHRRWGSKACYSCFEGYTLEGNECRTCNADQNWGGRTPSCEGCDSITNYRCNTGLCIPLSYKCDGNNDCRDNSDEGQIAGCNSVCESPSEFKCGDRECIPARWLCDGENDCDDNTDEANCTEDNNPTISLCNPQDEFACDSGFLSVVAAIRCVSKTRKCDGDPDCMDGSDEEGCEDLESSTDQKVERFERIVNGRLEGSNVENKKIRNETENRKAIESQMPSSCDEAATMWEGKGGVIEIYRNGARYEVYCDMTTDGGRWTVFQRRMDGTVDFYRDWEDYARGFGYKLGEFWLGLEAVYQLTQDGAYELRVDLTDWDGITRYAKYGTFAISGRSDNYRLTVGEYSGTSGDSFTDSNNSPFSAKNIDLDSWGASCAIARQVAWWFHVCAASSLNGRYNDISGDGRGVFWWHWKQSWRYSLKASEMKFRKK